MSEITESRLAMYEGIIALAWIDHTLHPDEKQSLHDLINNNPRFTDEQREILHGMADQKAKLEEIWPQITDKQDRAYLLDIANMIFHRDGEYCDIEKEVYEKYLAAHLETIDTEETMQELQTMAVAMRLQREAEEEAMEEYGDQFSLIGRLKNLKIW